MPWRPPCVDVPYDQHRISTPNWLQVGLSSFEARILKSFSKQLRIRRTCPTAATARMLIIWCLANIDEVGPRLEEAIRSCASGWQELDPACALAPKIREVLRSLGAKGGAR